jgi:lysophospholipase L1-like esterase
MPNVLLRRITWTTVGLLLISLLGVAGLEWYLSREAAPQATGQPRWRELVTYHTPFTVQHLHPFYQFFFPMDLEQRRTINNVHCNVSDDGFRGATPAEKGNRKLAFLLGDSLVFGFATNDSTTITGYLNRIQDEYLFINAGVPSWNSTQVLIRFSLEILLLNPDLIVAWGGYNDAAVTFNHAVNGRPYPPGTPESFELIDTVFDDIRAGPTGADRVFYERWFPELSSRLQARLQGPNLSSAPIRMDTVADQTAEQYLSNLAVMADLARARDIPFIGVFQPILSLHQNADPASFDVRTGLPEFIEEIHTRIITQVPEHIPYVDLSGMFDRHFESIPVFTPGRGPDLQDQVFTDIVHMYDPGHEIVAEELWLYIQSSIGQDPPPRTP